MAGVKRGANEHCRSFLVDRISGSLIAPPSDRRKEYLSDSLLHQFLVLNGSISLLALPVLGGGCADGGARQRSRKAHSLVLETERAHTVCPSRCNEYEQRTMHGGGLLLGSPAENILTGEPSPPRDTTPRVAIGSAHSLIRSSKTSQSVPSLRRLGRYFGRADDGYRVFDVWATRRSRNTCSESSGYSCVEPYTGPKNEVSEQELYLFTKYKYFSSRLAPHAVRGRRNNCSAEESRSRAVSDQPIPLLGRSPHNHRFMPQLHSAARDVPNKTRCIPISIFDNQNRLDAGYLSIPLRILPSADLLTCVRDSKKRLPVGIVWEGSWDRANFHNSRVTGTGIGIATNRRRFGQSGIHGILRSNSCGSVTVLPRLGRKPFRHLENQIRRALRQKGNAVFRDAANQHPLSYRRTGETNWSSDHQSGGGNRKKYMDPHLNVYECPNRIGEPGVPARHSATSERSSSVTTLYDRARPTSGWDTIGRRSSTRCVDLSFICNRLDFAIRGFAGDSSGGRPTNTMIVHPETNCGTSGRKPSPRSDGASPGNGETGVDRSFTTNPSSWIRRNKPGAGWCVGRSGGTVDPATLKQYNRFGPGKQIDMGLPAARRERGANAPLSGSSSYHLHPLGCSMREPSYKRNRMMGIPGNSNTTYIQFRNLPPTRALSLIPLGKWHLTFSEKEVASAIQSRVSDYIPCSNHSQGCDGPSATARYVRESFHPFPARRTADSPLSCGRTKVSLTRNSSITKPFRRRRVRSLGEVTSYCWSHACTSRITTPTKEPGCHEDFVRGRKGASFLDSVRVRSHVDEGVGVQDKEDSLYYQIGEQPSGSSVDLASLIRHGGVNEGSIAESGSYGDRINLVEPCYPTRPDEEPVEEAEICMTRRRGNASGERGESFRSYTPLRSPIRRWWKYQRGAISETSASQEGDGRTDTIRGAAGTADQPLPREPVIWRWLSNNDCHDDEYLTMGLPFLALLALRKGSSYIDLWGRLAFARDFIDAARRYHRSNRSMHRRGMMHHPIWGQNGFFPSPTNIKRLVKSIGSVRTGEGNDERSDGSKNLDFYPTAKAPPVEFVMGRNIYRNELGFLRNHNSLENGSSHRTAREQGLYYPRYLTEGYDDNIANPLRHSDPRNWVYLAPRQRVAPLNYAHRIPPVRVQSGFSPFKGAPLIGSAETGRSYLIDDLAAGSDAHSVPISMSDLYGNEHDLTDDIRMHGMKLLATSLCRFISILGPMRKMPSCVIRIRDMHELDFKGGRSAHQPAGTELALRSFSVLSAGPTTHVPGTVVIGSTHLPGGTDPSPICANRSDRSIDVRTLSTPRRQKEFPTPPRNKRFGPLLQDDNASRTSAPGYIIMCYYARDLAAPAHETSLINISRSGARGHAIELVPLRQIVPEQDVCTDIDFHRSDKCVYRIERAAARSMVVGIIPTGSPLYGSGTKDPLKRKLDCLSARHLEQPSIAENTAREFTRLSRVSSNPVEPARYDRLFVDDRGDSSNSVRSIEYDYASAACGASRDFVAGSPTGGPETRRDGFAGGTIGSTTSRRSQVRTPPDTAWNAVPPVSDKEGSGTTNDATACAPAPLGPRPTSNASDWVQIPTPAWGRRTLTNHPSWMNPNPACVPRHPLCHTYERILFQRLSGMIEETESQPESMPLKDRLGVLGIYGPAVHYRTGCRLNQSVLFTGKRFVWDGSSSRDCIFAFSYQPFMERGELVSGRGGFLVSERNAVLGNDIGFYEGTDQQPLAWDGTDESTPNKAGESTAAKKGGAPGAGGSWRRGIGIFRRIGNTVPPRLEHTHLFHPVYLYQARAVLEHSSDTFARSEPPNHQERRLGVGSLSSSPSIHSILSESHRYLLKNTRAANRASLYRAIEVCSKN
nr:hypothetical chloroplast RF21 [Selaginella stauntoniana]